MVSVALQHQLDRSSLYILIKVLIIQLIVIDLIRSNQKGRCRVTLHRLRKTSDQIGSDKLKMARRCRHQRLREEIGVVKPIVRQSGKRKKKKSAVKQKRKTCWLVQSRDKGHRGPA